MIAQETVIRATELSKSYRNGGEFSPVLRGVNLAVKRGECVYLIGPSGDPQLILADEPTASLDAEAGANAMRVLKDLCCEMQKTVLVVTHDSRIYSLADRILRLTDGQIAGEGAASTTN